MSKAVEHEIDCHIIVLTHTAGVGSSEIRTCQLKKRNYYNVNSMHVYISYYKPLYDFTDTINR